MEILLFVDVSRQIIKSFLCDLYVSAVIFLSVAFSFFVFA